MNKPNILLTIFNVVLTIALIIMTLLYLNAQKYARQNLDLVLESANENFEANKRISDLEEELAGYKNTEVKSVTNTLNNKTTNTANYDKNQITSTEPYIPDGMQVADTNDTNGIKASDIDFDREPENVTIEIIEGTLTKSSIDILITDNNKDKYGWGVEFRIQEKLNGKWQDLKYISDEVGWIMIAYNLDENNQLKQTIKWDNYYGSLDKGTYRIVKPVYDNGYIDLYSNEFEIK